MHTVRDVVVRRPTEQEVRTCAAWPVWRCEPSTFDWVYTADETCLIVQGKVTVRDREHSVCFGPGDLVVLPKGLECVWQVHEAVVKHYDFS